MAAAALAAALTAGAAQAASCSPSRIAGSATALQDSRFALSQLPPHDGTATAIPLETGNAIADIKTRLAAFITAYMSCQRTNADPDGIQIDLSRLGWARAPDAAPPSSSGAGPFKPDPTLTFEARPVASRMLGIVARFGVPCGSDALLMLFSASEDTWAETMRVGAVPYGDLSHGHEAFDYAVSPPDDAGHWFLVEKHLPVTCLPFNAAIAYSVLRAGPVAARPRLLFSGHDAMFSGDGDTGRVSAESDGFEVRFHDHGDAADIREIVRRYSVAGNTVRPIDPDDP
ncbi:MAG TPA: hypothetical protein VGB91_13305 [Rhizomicrobium sp.]